MQSVRKLTLSFAIVTIFGLFTTWISSCANSEAAQEPGTDTHVYLSQTLSKLDLLITGNEDTSILKRIDRIETRLGQPGPTGDPASGSGLTKTVESLAALTSKLSDDIGLMADRIVDTEKLIVAVIANQTQAAQGVIANAKDRDGSPLVPGLDGVPVNEIPMVLSEILAAVGGGGGASAVVLNTPANIASITPTVPPEIVYNVSPMNSYQLLVSDDPRFPGAAIKSIVDNNANPGAAESIASVWQDAVSVFGGVPLGGQLILYVAVQNIDSVNNNQLSGISNSIKLVVGP